MIKVMIVDDSRFMRNLIKNILEKYEDIKIINESKDGIECLENLINLAPDIILLDIEMPNLDGKHTLKEIIKRKIKTKVIMFSTLTKSGSSETIECLNIGAYDFLEKPVNPLKLDKIKEEIVNKIKIVNDSTYIVQEKEIKNNGNIVLDKKYNYSKKEVQNLVLIGCSTGGPNALGKVLENLNENTNASILIVQHMPEGDYISSLAKNLNRKTTFKVKEAENNEEIKNGVVYLCPGGKQMKINNNKKIILTEDFPENGHKPSVDYMFREISKFVNMFNKVIPIVLTGMGADGAKG